MPVVVTKKKRTAEETVAPLPDVIAQLQKARKAGLAVRANLLEAEIRGLSREAAWLRKSGRHDEAEVVERRLKAARASAEPPDEPKKTEKRKRERTEKT